MSDSVSISTDRQGAIALAAAQIVAAQVSKSGFRSDNIAPLLAKVLNTFADNLPQDSRGAVKRNPKASD